MFDSYILGVVGLQPLIFIIMGLLDLIFLILGVLGVIFILIFKALDDETPNFWVLIIIFSCLGVIILSF